MALSFLCDDAFPHPGFPIKDDVSLLPLPSRIFFPYYALDAALQFGLH